MIEYSRVPKAKCDRVLERSRVPKAEMMSTHESRVPKAETNRLLARTTVYQYVPTLRAYTHVLVEDNWYQVPGITVPKYQHFVLINIQ